MELCVQTSSLWLGSTPAHEMERELMLMMQQRSVGRERAARPGRLQEGRVSTGKGLPESAQLGVRSVRAIGLGHKEVTVVFFSKRTITIKWYG